MRTLTYLLAVTVALTTLAAVLVPGPAKYPPSRSDEAQSLIAKLGDPAFREREAAAKALTDLCYAALPALRKAAAGHADAEVRQRAMELVQSIERRRFKELHRSDGHGGGGSCVVFLSDGKLLSGGRDGPLLLWDTDQGTVLRRFEGHEKTARCVALSADGKRALSGGEDKTIRLWDVAAVKALRQWNVGDEVRAITFAAEDKQAVAATGYEYFCHSDFFYNYSVVELDLAAERPLRTFKGTEGGISGAALSPDGGQVVFGWSTNRLTLWNVATARELGQLEGGKSYQTGSWAACFSADGKQVLGVADDRVVRLWDAVRRQPLKIFEGHE